MHQNTPFKDKNSKQFRPIPLRSGGEETQSPLSHLIPSAALPVSLAPSVLECVQPTHCFNSVFTVSQTRGQSNLTKSASRGTHSPVRGHPGGRKLYH